MGSSGDAGVIRRATGSWWARRGSSLCRGARRAADLVSCRLLLVHLTFLGCGRLCGQRDARRVGPPLAETGGVVEDDRPILGHRAGPEGPPAVCRSLDAVG